MTILDRVSVKKKDHFKNIFGNCRRFSSHSLTMYVSKRIFLDVPAAGIVISKKVSKRAVDRNKCKRRLKSLLFIQKSGVQFPFKDIILVGKKPLNTLSFSDLKSELIDLVSNVRFRV